ncbi:MAG: N-acetylmuramoyl-L-alanine amidase [Lachnospiraceae bacterium]|nr:N-acetylmuramoyl-L-alanine amidase [Lachnospiraceae bacterium]
MKKHLLLLFSFLYCTAAMVLMVFFFLNRDVSAEGLTDGLNPDGSQYMDDLLYSQEGTSHKDCFCIPLEEGVAPEDVAFTSDPFGRVISIDLPMRENDFYYRNSLTGNRSHLTGIAFSVTDTGVHFELTTDTILVPRTIFEDGSLYLKLDKPGEIYDRIVLIDAGHGGSDEGTTAYGLAEKDILLGVCERIRDPELPSTCIYYTRTDDSSMSEADRLAIVRALEPDLIISIHTNADRSTRITRGVRTLYSKPYLSEKAEKLSALLSQKTGLINLGAAEDDYSGMLKDTDVPCFLIQLGYMTNKAEAERMAGDDFQAQAAEAVSDFITGYSGEQ